MTTLAAKKALDTRYRLLDYLYTAFHQAKADGTPVLAPLWYHYPKDTNTFGIDTQFFFGPSILVSPVTEENSTSVDVYFPPNELFYDFHTLEAVRGNGTTTLSDIDFTSIPVSVQGGAILPLRVHGAMTTEELRTTDFELVVAPDTKGSASGSLYLDDGVSIVQEKTTEVSFAYTGGKGRTGSLLIVRGSFDYPTGVKLARVRFASIRSVPRRVEMNGRAVAKEKITFDHERGVLVVELGIPFSSNFTIEVASSCVEPCPPHKYSNLFVTLYCRRHHSNVFAR